MGVCIRFAFLALFAISVVSSTSTQPAFANGKKAVIEEIAEQLRAVGISRTSAGRELSQLILGRELAEASEIEKVLQGLKAEHPELLEMYERSLRRVANRVLQEIESLKGARPHPKNLDRFIHLSLEQELSRSLLPEIEKLMGAGASANELKVAFGRATRSRQTREALEGTAGELRSPSSAQAREAAMESEKEFEEMVGEGQIMVRPQLEHNLREANFTGQKTRYAYGEDAKLSGADISQTELHYANLRRASLDEAKAIGTDFHHADLRGVHAHRANFQQANFNRADLGGADFSGANFVGANLQEANIGSGFGFTSTRFTDATFCVAGPLKTQLPFSMEEAIEVHKMVPMVAIPVRQGNEVLFVLQKVSKEDALLVAQKELEAAEKLATAQERSLKEMLGKKTSQGQGMKKGKTQQPEGAQDLGKEVGKNSGKEAAAEAEKPLTDGPAGTQATFEG